MISLTEALTQIAHDIGHDPADLIRYAGEDTIGGRDTPIAGWAAMAMHEAECKVLYAVIRALKPDKVLEIGTAEGCTATHILTALERNGTGHLWSYDTDASAGWRVPQALYHRWTFVHTDGHNADVEAEVVFEDGPHTAPWTSEMHAIIKDTLRPRVMLTHDFYTHLTYSDFKVEEETRAVYGDAIKGLHITGAFTGLGYWVNPEYDTSEATWQD